MHNFISSGFVTLGRGHLKGKVDPHYLFFHITVPLKTKFRIIIILFTKLLCHAVILLLPNECAVKKSHNVTVTFVSAQWKLDITIHKGLK